MPQLPFPPKALLPLVPQRFRDRGHRYYLDGRVLKLQYEPSSRVLRGEVMGTSQHAYQVWVRLQTLSDGRPAMDNYCTCPVGRDCKHVVAVLLLAQDRWGGQAAPEGLPADLARWVQQAARITEAGHKTDTRCLLYLLDPGGDGRPPSVHTVTVRRLKKGGYGKPSLFDPTTVVLPAYLDAADLRALSWLRMDVLQTGEQGVALTPREGPGTLEALLDTGRLHLEDRDGPGPLLAQGGPRSGRLEWTRGGDGLSRVRLQAEPRGMRVLALAPPWYLDPEAGLCGPLETGLDAQAACLLASAPPVPPDAIDPLRKILHERAPGAALPLPRALKRRRKSGVKPVPVLRLRSEEDSAGPGLPPAWLEMATLSFDYAGVEIPPHNKAKTVRQVQDDRLLEIRRQPKDEESALELLREMGFEVGYQAREDEFELLPAKAEDYLEFWFQFMEAGVPELRRRGWRIEIEEGFRFHLVHPVGWDAQVEENPGNGWLDLSLGVEVETAAGRERVELLPLLVEALERLPTDITQSQFEALAGQDTHMPLPLPDGRLLMMPMQRLAPILGTLVELYQPGALSTDGRLPLAPTQGGQLAELEERAPQIQWQGGEAARAWGRRLRDFQGIRETSPPAGLNAELRPYQRRGLDWLQFLREYALGGVLADDMGLGKTIQTLAHLLVEKEAGRADRPSLVVAPTSLMFNWRREAGRFTPGLRVLVSHGPQRKARFDQIPGYDLVLTTYPLLSRDAEALGAHRYHLLVLDEAQAVKNPRSKAAQAVRAFDARHRLALTGTPMENHLGELWSLFDFLMPGLLGDERRFRQVFRNPIEKAGDSGVQEQLRRRVRPFLLRRTKEEVAAELPPKTEILRTVALTGDQLDLYETLRLAMHERVRAEVQKRGLARSGIVILDALLKLRQVCCDPRLVKLESARRVKQSAKLDLLMELLPDLIEDGRRVLLFSQFTSMLGLIEAEVRKRAIQYVKLTGQTRKREEVVERFQTGEVPLFLISLKAGGSGLNLTAADCVIHYDPWWNPAAERQATDRAHRIGQDKPVFAYRLLTEGTVEEKVAELQARKQALADAVLEGGGAALGHLDEADIETLFAPLEA